MRPEGQPGTVRAAFTYHAVLNDHGTWFWRDGSWLRAPHRLAAKFTAGPDWQERCDHEPGGLPWRTCDSEADCLSLRREEGRDRR